MHKQSKVKEICDAECAFQVGLVVKNLPADAGDVRDKVRSLGRGDPLEEGMATTPVFLPGEFHGQMNLAGYSSWGCKESDTTDQLSTAQHMLSTAGEASPAASGQAS